MIPAPPPVLLTRPLAQSERFARDLRARLGEVRVVISPVLRIETRPVPSLEGVEGLILTSANAVRAMGDAARGMEAWCVGDRTAQAARDAGLRAVSAGGDAEALIARIAADAPAGRLLHLHGAETRGDVAGRLRVLGLTVDDAVIYDQRPEPLNDAARALLDGSAPVVALLFSPRSAALLGEAARNARAPLRLAAISPATAEAWAGPAPARLVVAERPDAAAILDAVETICAPPPP